MQTEFAALNADYAEMQKNYNALLEKQQEAAMTSALNQREQSQPFVVVQPANLPSRPFRPDPVLLQMGVVLMGLLIGLLCGLVVELKDDTMHDSDEVAAYLKLPVMVALPKCPGYCRSRRGRRARLKVEGSARAAMETQGYGEEQMKIANIQQESASVKQMDSGHAGDARSRPCCYRVR